jgi:hypothetical protein
MLRLSIFAMCILLSSAANASYWKIEKNEKDPFDKSKSTFVAATIENGHALAVRCIEGTISFAFSIPSGSVTQDEDLDIKVVADGKDPVTSRGVVLTSNLLMAMIQFGDETTADYLKGAKKFFLRTVANDQSNTFGFTGGKSLDESLVKAKAACGIAQTQISQPTAEPSPNNAAQMSAENCTKEKSCYAQFGCLAYNHQLGDNPDPQGFVNWCKRQPGMSR